MRLMINAFKAALAVSCLAVAACGSNSSPVSQASANSDAIKASVSATSASRTTSLSGTIIPAATQIIDSGGNVWTVSGGVVYEHGALAGYSKAVAKLLYDDNTVYQENTAGAWWSWNGSTWVSSGDPTKVASANGTSVPAATQITDGSGNVWAVSGGVIYEDGALAGYSNAVAKLLYDNNTVYQENTAGGWWSWKGNTWVSSADPTKVASASGTSVPTVTQITDSSGNVWTVSGGVVYKDGALAGYSSAVAKLLYDNNTVYQENTTGGWWSWNGNTWVTSSDPVGTGGGGGSSSTGSASLSWTAPTRNTDGTPLMDLAGYTIYYGTNPSALTQTVQVANPSAVSYVVSNLSAGTYYFAVVAYTAVGTQSAQSSESSKTIL